MAFEEYVPLNPIGHIHELEITLFRTVEVNHPEGPQSVRFQISVYNQRNEPVDHKSGDLIPHAPQQIGDALEDIMDWAWAKAENEVLP